MAQNTSLQQPIGSGFNAQATTEEVIKGIDLTGKTAIVTGGYAGIGLETTRVLAAAGAAVIVPARDTAKAQKNIEGIANVSVAKLDLMAPASIDAFAAEFLATGKPLHLLINNAGIMWVPLRRDARGYESQLVTNHLGHFQLTARLWPALKEAKGARVVNVSSLGHHMAPFNFEDPNFEHRPYETLQGYGQSKTANILFTVAFDKRASAHSVRAYALHPGAVGGTDLAREASSDLLQHMGILNEAGEIRPEVLANLKTIPQGAATTVWCATSPQLQDMGGVYCEDVEVANPATDATTGIQGVKAYALDAANAEKLWELSETLTCINFEID